MTALVTSSLVSRIATSGSTGTHQAQIAASTSVLAAATADSRCASRTTRQTRTLAPVAALELVAAAMLVGLGGRIGRVGAIGVMGFP